MEWTLKKTENTDAHTHKGAIEEGKPNKEQPGAREKTENSPKRNHQKAVSWGGARI